ncbi:MAG: bifunctional hydroxymethylpyrimidine kinase/phosphomethylpyrimidine kinase [Nitrospinae bacterium]|nr:bifunctional hydroxymethylpyrimidine kinase/phosphomethylpyrimidine kinase [Nitrospinota bacterium]
MKKVLTIAGSDPCGGAGIQGDLKTFARFGVYGLSVITSITAQNTVGVQTIHDLPPDLVGSQIDSIARDINIDAVKTGMISNSGIIEKVSECILAYSIQYLVVDPVMYAKDGTPLLQPEARERLIKRLFPLSYLITPNIPEAEALSGIKIKDIGDMKRAIKKIKGMGVNNIIIKGGHLNLKGDAVDILYDGNGYTPYRSERIETGDIHGTGCTFAAAITAGLAQDMGLKEAVRSAKEFITTAIQHSLSIGKGLKISDHLFSLYRDRERYILLKRVEEAIKLLEKGEIGPLIPEVQSNLGAGLTSAYSINDVIGIPGRIIRYGKDIRTLSRPDFGVSRHIGRTVLTVMRHDPTKRAVMNIRYSDEIIDACRRLGMGIAQFDRRDEPEEVRSEEGQSLEWGINKAIKEFGSVPEIIYDKGGMGKEGMIRVIGDDPIELSLKILKIKGEVIG